MIHQYEKQFIVKNYDHYKEQFIVKMIHGGYLNFWNEYAIYFIEGGKKCIFHEW